MTDNVGAWMRREHVGGGGVSGQDVRERNPKSSMEKVFKNNASYLITLKWGIISGAPFRRV
ncbi:MAG: hypothetical protein FWF68_05880 [Spirochaetes bacterium]|nr:hypothetical protein [Spirochaetota bacterium]